MDILGTLLKTQVGTLQIIALGGQEGAGGPNCFLFCYRHTDGKIKCLIIDCGGSFNGNLPPEVSMVLPNLDILREIRGHEQFEFLGILVTHAHLDHIAGIEYVIKLLPRFKIPVYGTPFTCALLKMRLGSIAKRAEIIPMTLKQKLKDWGGCFQIEFFEVCHSIPGAVGIVIETPEHFVIHTGDFSLGTSYFSTSTDLDSLKSLGQKAKLLRKQIILTVDATTADEVNHAFSDQKVFDTLDHIFNANKDQRILITTFSTLITRLQMVFDLAEKYRRYVAVAGPSIRNMINFAQERSYLNTHERRITLREAETRPSKEVCVLLSGSQFRRYSAAQRFAAGTHAILQPKPNEDCVVISASEIKPQTIRTNINLLIQKGVRVFTEDDAYLKNEYTIHRSGHVVQSELEEFFKIFGADTIVVPIQSDLRGRQLATEIAAKCGLQTSILFSDNYILEIIDEKARILNIKIPGGPIWIDKDGKVIN